MLFGLCTGLGLTVLIAQGVVPLILKVSGTPTRSWFLGLWLPDPWSWAVLGAMVALGLAMVTVAVLMIRRALRRRDLALDRPPT